IVCTDGRDTQSWLQADEVTDVAKRSNAVIYAVAAGARRSGELKVVADVTGGQLIEIDTSAGFRSQLARILQEVRSRFVLSFTPQDVAAGGYHRLDVDVMTRKGLTVKARSGYLGRSPGGGE